MSEVSAVTFRNREGLRLFGTLHKGDRAASGGKGFLPAVVLLSPGVKMRVGPGRIYVPLTEMFTSIGYTVLRFDFHGLGDSEGELQERLVADVYGQTEQGRYVNDALDAIEWLRSVHGFQRFVVGGLCGGAVTALLAAEREPRICALVLFGTKVTRTVEGATPARFLTRAQLDDRRAGYFRRILQPRSWIRFLTFRSEYGVIWRSLRQLFRRENPPVSSPSSDPAERGNANPLIPPALFSFLERGGRALMLFSEKDRLQSQYDEKVAQPFAERLQPHLSQIHYHVVQNANHVLSLREWQQEMVDVTRRWMEADLLNAGLQIKQ